MDKKIKEHIAGYKGSFYNALVDGKEKYDQLREQQLSNQVLQEEGQEVLGADDGAALTL